MSSAVASSKKSSKSKSSSAKSNKTIEERTGSPVADLEYEDPAEEVPDQDVEDDGPEESLIVRIRNASSDIFKETNRPATNAEIAEVLGEEVEKVKSARDSLKNARKRQRMSALRRKALQVGYSRRKGLSRAEAQGLDMDRTLLSVHDIKRLMRSLPLNFENGSYSAEELKMKMELAFENMPINVAREIIAFLEPIFRSIMNECVDRQVRSRTMRITPAVMYNVLKKYNGLGLFSGATVPEGLIKHCKQTGLELKDRSNPDAGMLMTASKEDKKQWKAEKPKNQQMAEVYNEMLQQEKKRMEKKRSKSAGEDAAENESEEATEVAPSEEQEGEAVSRPKKKKAKKAATA